MTQLLKLQDVGLERGVRQLFTGVQLEVVAGELWQLVGSNGSGKTSLLRAVAGLARLGVQGSITCCPSMLFQGHLPGLKSALTCRENLLWHASGGVAIPLSGIDHALAEVGLAEEALAGKEPGAEALAAVALAAVVLKEGAPAVVAPAAACPMRSRASFQWKFGTMGLPGGMLGCATKATQHL